jgi:hypothetical protein
VRGDEQQKAEQWQQYCDHTVQVALLLATMVFITLVNFSLVVYARTLIVTFCRQNPIRISTHI